MTAIIASLVASAVVVGIVAMIAAIGSAHDRITALEAQLREQRERDPEWQRQRELEAYDRLPYKEFVAWSDAQQWRR
jgi:hypothetical protein